MKQSIKTSTTNHTSFTNEMFANPANSTEVANTTKPENEEQYFKSEKSLPHLMKVIYSHRPKEKGDLAILANLANSETEETNITPDQTILQGGGFNEPPTDSPNELLGEDGAYRFIPDSVYENLPSLLKEPSAVFVDRNERDVFLTGALSVLGGSFVNLYAYNEVDKKRVAPNLFAFIVAPPASGKGALKYARKLVNEMKVTFAKLGSKILIPANISTAGLVQLLQANEGTGVMIESEIDTLVNANKQDWGNYTDILRNSFENESCTLYRKNSPLLEIENLKFSLAISGTKGQFKALMGSTENGLFSRGCYYVFENSDETLKCFGRLNTSTDIEDLFAKYANVANSYLEKLMSLEYINVSFSEAQLSSIQQTLQDEYDQTFKILNLQPSIKRAFVIIQKIATILEYLFMCESDSLASSSHCSEKALKLATELGLVYLRHAYRAFGLLPKENPKGITVDQARFHSKLPNETFTREQAILIGQQLGIPARTLDKMLRDLTQKGGIFKMGHGKYKKAA